VAASFGLASALSVVVLGDESGYTATENQQMKIAAIEAMWHTEPAPASFTLFGLPSVADRDTRYAIEVPWLLGLIATRSLDTPIPGIDELVASGATRIRSGMVAYQALQTMRQHPADPAAAALFQQHVGDLGYALLLKRYTAAIVDASAAQINAAANDLIPDVPVLFWSFRVMAGIGFYLIALFTLAFVMASLRRLDRRWFLWIALLSLPLPWVAIEVGWIVAEYGRQPWVVDGVLPTFLGVSSTSVGQVALSLAGFVLFYSALAVVDAFLLVKYIRQGPPPSTLGIDRTPAFHVRAAVGSD
jgi:cytochrome bd ubiquinol oxidase subunit I